MADVKINAQTRTEFGKGAARRTRRAGRVPAVLYGHGTDPVHLSFDTVEFAAVMRENGRNAVLTIAGAGSPQLALTKSVVRDPIKGFIEHVDLVVVRRGEKVAVDVPVVTLGEAAPGSLVFQNVDTLTIEADAMDIPEEISLVIDGAAIGTQFQAGDIRLPDGSTLVSDAETPGRQRHRGADRGGPRGGDRHRGRRRRGGRAGVRGRRGLRARRGLRRRGARGPGRRRGRDPRQGRLTGRAERRERHDCLPRVVRPGAGRRPGQPGGGVRRHPAQRRVRGRRRARRARRWPLLRAPQVGCGHRRGSPRGPQGDPGQAARLHEPLRRPGDERAAVLLGAPRGPRRRARRPRPGVRRRPAQARRRGGRAQRPALDLEVPRDEGLPPGAVRHRPPARAAGPADYVLRRWSSTERRELDVSLELAADAVEALLTEGLEPAQNRIH